MYNYNDFQTFNLFLKKRVKKLGGEIMIIFEVLYKHFIYSNYQQSVKDFRQSPIPSQKHLIQSLKPSQKHLIQSPIPSQKHLIQSLKPSQKYLMQLIKPSQKHLIQSQKFLQKLEQQFV